MTTHTAYLLEAHCLTAAGSGIQQALAASSTGDTGVTTHSGLMLAGGDGTPQPVSCGGVLPLAAEERPPLLLDTFLENLGEPTASEAVWLALPPTGVPRAVDFPAAELERAIADAFGATVRSVHAESGTTPLLAELIATMHNDGLHSAWLVAVDSLLDPDTLMELDAGPGVQRTGVDGLVPGEAVTAIRIAREAASTHPRITVHTATGPAGGARDGRAWGQAIEQAAAQAGCSAGDIQAVYTDSADNPDAARAWSQCVPRLWPHRLTEEQHHALELGMIEPFRPPSNEPPLIRTDATLGAAGIATIPLHLGLAHAWRAWQRRWASFGLTEPAEKQIVCEHASDGRIHAVVLY